MENAKYVQIRAVSNYVEPRNKENWQMGLAIKNLNEYLITLLK
jgi:futalosine hydrolase